MKLQKLGYTDLWIFIDSVQIFIIKIFKMGIFKFLFN